MNPDVSQILQFLAAAGPPRLEWPIKTSRLESRLHWSAEDVRLMASDLESRGLVEPAGEDAWRVTAAGKALHAATVTRIKRNRAEVI